MGLGTLLIRADASPDIGTGHVMRCLAIAQAWQDRGGRAIFFMAKSTPAINERLSGEGCEIVANAAEIGGATDARITVETCRKLASDWLILDGYCFDSQYEARVCEAGPKVLYVEDWGMDRTDANIVLNPNLTARESQYTHRPGSVRLLGTRYALLRREFRNWTNWHREIPASARKVLVTLGGSTPEHVAVRILEALTMLKNEIEQVFFVMGASSREHSSLARAAAPLDKRVTFQRAATDMATLMAQADIAIAAAGSTCWEMCFMGLPSLIMDVADNQTAEAMELDRQGCAKYLGNANTFRAETLASELSTMLGSEKMRSQMSSRCRSLVDGRGAERVVSAMLGDSCADTGTPREEALA